jgi:glycosyltransferase involved in cell wall biosynthesis
VRDGICPAGKIRVLAGGSGNGVDAEGRFNPDGQPSEARAEVRRRLGIPAGAPVILFVGRVVRDKGVSELAAAWREIREEYSDAHLILVGPVEAEDPVPPQAWEVLLDDPRIHLTGMQKDAASFYALADLVVLPTYREGFPNVLLEAAAMALPVVATRVGGCVDAVEENATGILVEPRDARELGGAIRRYLDNPGLRRAHGRAARQRALRTFRPSAIWEGLHGEYLRLLGARAVRLPPGSAAIVDRMVG